MASKTTKRIGFRRGYNWARSACDLDKANLLVTTEPKLFAPFGAHFEAP